MVVASWASLVHGMIDVVPHRESRVRPTRGRYLFRSITRSLLPWFLASCQLTEFPDSHQGLPHEPGKSWS